MAGTTGRIENSTEKRDSKMETKATAQVLKLAIRIFAFYAKQWEAYERDCDDYAKQGYRPASCFHGTNLWVDYDPICGACEDGYGWFDPMLYRQLAIAEAKAAYDEFNERIDFYMTAMKKNAPVDAGKMITWVSEPLNKWGAHTENAKATAQAIDGPAF